MFRYWDCWNRRNNIESKVLNISYSIMCNNKTNHQIYNLLLPVFVRNNIELGHFAPMIRKLHPERFPN